MNCTSCGNTVLPEWSYCPWCNEPIREAETEICAQERILLGTEGSGKGYSSRTQIVYCSAFMGITAGVVLVLLETMFRDDQNRFFSILCEVLLTMTIPVIILILAAASRFRKADQGHLLITDRVVEGLASRRQPYDFDLFAHPAEIQICMEDIVSAGTDEDGAFLIVETRCDVYAFATPEARRASRIISRLVSRNDLEYGC